VREARRGTTWSIVATILSGLAVAGLGFTLWQTQGSLAQAKRSNLLAMRANGRATRQAVAGAEDTRAALKIAQDQLELARATSKISLRPYLTMEGIRPRRFDESVDRFKISFRNTGKSPALIKTMRWDADTFTDVIRQFPVPFGREIMSPLVGPGERQAAYTLFNEAWEIEAKPKVLSGERKMIVHYA
jgi:hypothetical protein